MVVTSSGNGDVWTGNVLVRTPHLSSEAAMLMVGGDVLLWCLLVTCASNVTTMSHFCDAIRDTVSYAAIIYSRNFGYVPGFLEL